MPAEILLRKPVDAFGGLVTNLDALDLDAGQWAAAENIGCYPQGLAQVRRGYTPAAFAASLGTGDGIAIYGFHRPEAEWLVWELTNGKLQAGWIGNTSHQTLYSSFNVFQPLDFAKDRFNRLIAVNGVDRGKIWNGLTSAPWELGITAPTSAPSITSPAGGSLSVGDYTLAYRWLDADLQPSSLSPSATHTAAASDKFVWTNLEATTETTRVAYVELWRSASGAGGEDVNGTVWFVIRLGYSGSITSSANSGGFVRFTVPEGHNLVVGAQIRVTGHSVAGYNTDHIVTAMTSTTLTTDIAYSAAGTGGTWRILGYNADTASDTTLQATTNDSMRWQNDNGTLVARRFVPPPNHKQYISFFQDRAWYGGTVEYNVGTVQVTNGATAVLGTSTNWTSQMAGRRFSVRGDTRSYEIYEVGGAGTLTLTESYQGSNASGLSYVIQPQPDERRQLYFSEPDEPESVSTTNTVIVQENVGDDDEMTGMMPHGPFLYLLFERHIYALSFNRQPTIDVSIVLRVERGAFNDRCCDKAEDLMYLMDQSGMYRFDGQSFENIGEPLHNYWRDGTVDLTKSKWFFVHTYREEEVVGFHVVLAGESATRPNFAFFYHYRNGTWTTHRYAEEYGGCARQTTSGRYRSYACGEDDRVFLTHQGYADGIATALTGTMQSATSNTFVAAAGTGTDNAIGASVVITSGTGKLQAVRKIASRSSDTYTIDANWATTPDSTSSYAIGGIPWSLRTKRFRPVDEMSKNAYAPSNPQSLTVRFEPTTNSAIFDIRRYVNYRSSPENALNTLREDYGLTSTQDDPDYVQNMAVNQDVLADNSGVTIFRLEAAGSDVPQRERFQQFMLRGCQHLDRIKIPGLIIDGLV